MATGAEATTGHQPRWISTFDVLRRGVGTVLAVDVDGIVRSHKGSLGGVPDEALASKPLWEHALADGERLHAAIDHAFRPGVGQRVEALMGNNAPGTWHRFHVIPCHEMALVQVTDIDQEQREAERLRHSERMMLDAQGMAHLGTWYWNIAEPHARWSPELYAIYGLDASNHVPTYEDYLTRIHPDDVERVKTATEAVFNDHATYSHDERILHTDGRWRHLHTWARPILDDAGALVALQGVCLDITARKEAEAALAQSEVRSRYILDHAGMGIASVLVDGSVHGANPAFDELTGEGATLQERFPHLAEAMAGWREAAEQRYTGTPARQPERSVRLLLTPEAEGIRICIAQDVTLEIAAQEASQRIQELEAQQAQQRRMVGVATHEIKNPLTPLLFQLHLLQRGMLGDLNDAQGAALKKMHRQAQRLAHVVEDTLSMTRVTDAPAEQAVETDLAPLIIDALSVQAPTADEFGVELQWDVPEEAMAKVHAGRVSQIIDNLVLNALRFTPSGGRVHVDLREDDDEWVITVRDDGVGIPEKQQATIFEAYARGDTEAPHPMPSTGLGLFIVKAFAEGEGGSVALASEEGKGTRVAVRLPK